MGNQACTFEKPTCGVRCCPGPQNRCRASENDAKLKFYNPSNEQSFEPCEKVISDKKGICADERNVQFQDLQSVFTNCKHVPRNGWVSFWDEIVENGVYNVPAECDADTPLQQLRAQVVSMPPVLGCDPSAANAYCSARDAQAQYENLFGSAKKSLKQKYEACMLSQGCESDCECSGIGCECSTPTDATVHPLGLSKVAGVLKKLEELRGVQGVEAQTGFDRVREIEPCRSGLQWAAGQDEMPDTSASAHRCSLRTQNNTAASKTAWASWEKKCEQLAQHLNVDFAVVNQPRDWDKPFGCVADGLPEYQWATDNSGFSTEVGPYTKGSIRNMRFVKFRNDGSGSVGGACRDSYGDGATHNFTSPGACAAAGFQWVSDWYSLCPSSPADAPSDVLPVVSSANDVAWTVKSDDGSAPMVTGGHSGTAVRGIPCASACVAGQCTTEEGETGDCTDPFAADSEESSLLELKELVASTADATAADAGTATQPVLGMRVEVSSPTMTKPSCAWDEAVAECKNVPRTHKETCFNGEGCSGYTGTCEGDGADCSPPQYETVVYPNAKVDVVYTGVCSDSSKRTEEECTSDNTWVDGGELGGGVCADPSGSLLPGGFRVTEEECIPTWTADAAGKELLGYHPTYNPNPSMKTCDAWLSLYEGEAKGEKYAQACRAGAALSQYSDQCFDAETRGSKPCAKKVVVVATTDLNRCEDASVQWMGGRPGSCDDVCGGNRCSLKELRDPSAASRATVHSAYYRGDITGVVECKAKCAANAECTGFSVYDSQRNPSKCGTYEGKSDENSFGNNGPSNCWKAHRGAMKCQLIKGALPAPAEESEVAEETTTYYITENGKTCGNSSNVIRSKDECKVALSKVGKSDRIVWNSTHSGIPGGCSVRGHNDGHYDNRGTSGTVGTGRSDLAAVCKNLSAAVDLNRPSGFVEDEWNWVTYDKGGTRLFDGKPTGNRKLGSDEVIGTAYHHRFGGYRSGVSRKGKTWEDVQEYKELGGFYPYSGYIDKFWYIIDREYIAAASPAASGPYMGSWSWYDPGRTGILEELRKEGVIDSSGLDNNSSSSSHKKGRKCYGINFSKCLERTVAAYGGVQKTGHGGWKSTFHADSTCAAPNPTNVITRFCPCLTSQMKSIETTDILQAGNNEGTTDVYQRNMSLAECQAFASDNGLVFSGGAAVGLPVGCSVREGQVHYMEVEALSASTTIDVREEADVAHRSLCVLFESSAESGEQHSTDMLSERQFANSAVTTDFDENERLVFRKTRAEAEKNVTTVLSSNSCECQLQTEGRGHSRARVRCGEDVGPWSDWVGYGAAAEATAVLAEETCTVRRAAACTSVVTPAVPEGFDSCEAAGLRTCDEGCCRASSSSAHVDTAGSYPNQSAAASACEARGLRLCAAGETGLGDVAGWAADRFFPGKVVASGDWEVASDDSQAAAHCCGRCTQTAVEKDWEEAAYWSSEA